MTEAAAAETVMRGLIIWKTVKEKTMARRMLRSMGVIKGGTLLLPFCGPQHAVHSET